MEQRIDAESPAGPFLHEGELKHSMMIATWSLLIVSAVASFVAAEEKKNSAARVTSQQTKSQTQSKSAETKIKLPASCDLRPVFAKYQLKPRSQGHRGTCSVFATTEALEFAMSKMHDKSIVLSPEYLNWASNKARNVPSRDVGQFFQNLLKGYQEYGICLEKEMPYSRRFNPNLEPSAEIVERAKTNKANQTKSLAIHWINALSQTRGLPDEKLTEIKATVAKGWPVAIGSSHSRLVVGYEDDPKEAGGGIFFVLDSALARFDQVSYEFVRKEVIDVFWIEVIAKEISR